MLWKRCFLIAALVATSANAAHAEGCTQCGEKHAHAAQCQEKLTSAMQKHKQKLGQFQGLLADQKKAFQGALADKKAKHKAMLPTCKHGKSGAGQECNTCNVGQAPVVIPEPQSMPVVASLQTDGVAYPPVASPQTNAPGSPVVPSVQALMDRGRCGGCYPAGPNNACPPRGPDGQWIIPECPIHASAQGNVTGSGQHAGDDCPPQRQNPACCGIPSFYCPPVVVPAIPAQRLQSGGKIFAMRTTRLPATPSNQNLPSLQSGQTDNIINLKVIGDD